MILQALKDYYDRKMAAPDGGIAPEGFEEKAIPYLILIDEAGRFVNLEFTGDEFSNKKGKSYIVPMWQQRAGKNASKTTHLLWDHLGYVLGWPKSDDEKDKDQARIQHSSFIRMIEEIHKVLPDNKAISAILNFYDNQGAEKVFQHERWNDAKEILGCNLSFRLNGYNDLILSYPEILAIADKWNGSDFVFDENRSRRLKGHCLITGEVSSIIRLHRPISGVNKKPSPMLAVNNIESPAFSSFNKNQGENFPIGERSAFKYATGLNFLLRKKSTQRLQINDITIIFWAEKQSHIEDTFSALFDDPPIDFNNPDRRTDMVRTLYKAVDSGAMPNEDQAKSFFVLGLSPNATRISVRLWYTGTIEELSLRIRQHFDDLAISHCDLVQDLLPLKKMLKAISPLNELGRVPPNMASDWTRSILTGLPYPDSLFQMALRKIKSHRDEKKMTKLKYKIEVEYPCVAILKAYLNRKARFQNKFEEEMTVLLDKENQNPGYKLGRLFAVLEKIQERAQSGINATIRDRYYSSVSTTPASVMPILMRLKNHHLAKIEEKGLVIYFEKMLGEIISDISDFPLRLNLLDQGRFAIGYYHQRQMLFAKPENQNEEK